MGMGYPPPLFLGTAVATRVLVRAFCVAVRAGRVAVHVRVCDGVRVSDGVNVSVAGPGVSVGPVDVGVDEATAVAVAVFVRVLVGVAPPSPTTIVT